jgi:hypothetical protein
VSTRPLDSTIKKLYSLANNHCSFLDPHRRTGCEQPIASLDWQYVNGEMCHIEGEKPGSARYREAMTNEERRSFENIIILCPNHHNVVDNLEPDRFTVDVLNEMKRKAESRAEPVENWANDSLLEWAVKGLALRSAWIDEQVFLPPISSAIDAQGSFRAEATTTVHASITDSGGGSESITVEKTPVVDAPARPAGIADATLPTTLPFVPGAPSTGPAIHPEQRRAPGGENGPHPTNAPSSPGAGGYGTGGYGTGPYGGGSGTPEENPLTIQVNQLFGYNGIYPLQDDPDGADFRLDRPITAVEMNGMRDLAVTNGLTIKMRLEGGSMMDFS